MASKGRWRIEDINPLIVTIEDKILPYCEEYMICGSYRRGLKTVGDVDIVVVPKRNDFPELEHKITELAGKILASGTRIIRILSMEGIQVDFNISTLENFQSACLHSTGSKWFNIKCRKIAQGMGLRLSQYGLISNDTGKKVAETELDILTILGMNEFIAPSSRK